MPAKRLDWFLSPIPPGRLPPSVTLSFSIDLSLHPPAIKTGAHLVFSGTFARSLWTRVTWIFFSAVWESSVIVETAIVQGDRASTCGAEIHLIYVRILFSGNRWIQSYCCYMIGLSLFSMVFTYVELERVYLEECIRWTGAWTPVNLYLAEVLHVRNDRSSCSSRCHFLAAGSQLLPQGRYQCSHKLYSVVTAFRKCRETRSYYNYCLSLSYAHYANYPHPVYASSSKSFEKRCNSQSASRLYLLYVVAHQSQC